MNRRWRTGIVACTLAMGLLEVSTFHALAQDEAERITRLTGLVEKAETEYAELNKQLKDPNSDYAKAESDFQTVHSEYEEKKKALANDHSGEEAAALQAEMKALEEKHTAYKDRFNAAIEQRKAMIAKLAVLKERIAQDRKQLATMQAEPQVAPMPREAPANAKLTNPVEAPSNFMGPTQPVQPKAPKPKPKPQAKNTTAELQAQAPDKETAAQVANVKHHVDSLKADLNQAAQEAKTLDDRVKSVQKNIDAETNMLNSERKAIDSSKRLLEQLNKTLNDSPPTEPAKMQALMEQIRVTEEAIRAGENRAAEINERIVTLREELASAKKELADADAIAKRKQAEAEKAQKELNELLDPFQPRNIYRRVLKHTPAVISIIIFMVIMHLMVRYFLKHIIRLATRKGRRGNDSDAVNRSDTLSSVFRYISHLMVFGGGIIMILDEVGVPVVPLMGGAAVFGLAVAFGAQNLIRDYFSGFMILMEDQYGINDVVRIGDISGCVERITLRITVLRDLEGVLHFIPHGTIKNVSNLTHGWSRCMFEIPVGHSEDLDCIIEIIKEVGEEMRFDPTHGVKIMDDLDMLGVDSITPHAAILKFLVKTRPLQQWPVKRELLKRLRNRFVELGISFPAPRQANEFPNGFPMMQTERQGKHSHNEEEDYAMVR